VYLQVKVGVKKFFAVLPKTSSLLRCMATKFVSSDVLPAYRAGTTYLHFLQAEFL
jgi:hypothetical protein